MLDNNTSENTAVTIKKAEDGAITESQTINRTIPLRSSTGLIYGSRDKKQFGASRRQKLTGGVKATITSPCWRC